MKGLSLDGVKIWKLVELLITGIVEGSDREGMEVEELSVRWVELR